MTKTPPSKRRKRLKIAAMILALPAIYLISIITLHFHNARFDRAYDNLRDAAQSNGLLVHHFNRPQSPAGFNRFYDESSTFGGLWGTSSSYAGFTNDEGEIVLPAIYRFPDSHFYEGLAHARNDDNKPGYIFPDGSWAFSIDANYAGAFFNGRARIRKKESDSSRTTPHLLDGFIDLNGNVVVETKYYGVKDFVGEQNNEFTLVWKRTPYYSIYETMMDGIDISIPLIAWLFPPTKAQFIDLDGNKATIADIRRSIKSLKSTAQTNQ